MIPPLFCISSVRIDQQANNNYIPLSTMHFFSEIHTVAETYSWFNCTFRRWVFPTLTPQGFQCHCLLGAFWNQHMNCQYHRKLTQFPWTAFKTSAVELALPLCMFLATTLLILFCLLIALTTSACLHFCLRAPLEIPNYGAKVSSRIWIRNTQILTFSSLLHIMPVICIYFTPSLTIYDFPNNHFHTNF